MNDALVLDVRTTCDKMISVATDIEELEMLEYRVTSGIVYIISLQYRMV